MLELRLLPGESITTKQKELKLELETLKGDAERNVFNKLGNSPEALAEHIETLRWAIQAFGDRPNSEYYLTMQRDEAKRRVKRLKEMPVELVAEKVEPEESKPIPTRTPVIEEPKKRFVFKRPKAAM